MQIMRPNLIPFPLISTVKFEVCNYIVKNNHAFVLFLELMRKNGIRNKKCVIQTYDEMGI